MSRARPALAPIAAGAALALGVLVLGVASAHSQCPSTTVADPNATYRLDYSPQKFEFDQEQSYWAVIGLVTNFPETSDWDLEIYATPFGGLPLCMSGYLGGSAYPNGYADFVVGDFNYNPFGPYYGRAFCYSGDCSSYQGIRTWRDGGRLLSVDAPAIVEEIPTDDYADQIVSIFDVFLLTGQKYWFRFSSTGDLQTKMFLFRNPSNGVYWAGRSAAVLTSSGCATYTAPSAGWYGVVVANDRRESSHASYTLGVYTSPNCGCPTDLAFGVPVHTPPPDETPAYYRAPDFQTFWQTIAVRGTTSDWDIDVGPQVSSGPNAFCMQGVDASSVLPNGYTDLVAAIDPTDSSDRDTLDARVFRYSGSGGATVERGPAARTLYYNDPVLIRNLGPDDITDLLYLPLFAGYSAHFEVTPYSNQLEVLRFGPDNGTPMVAPRTAGQPITTGTVISPVADGTAALAAVKDHLAPDAYAIRMGTCFGAFDWPDTGVYGLPQGISWFRLPPSGPHWTAYTAICPSMDWDLDQYGHSTGGAWPVCLDSPGAVSGSVGVADMMVGDLRYVLDDSVFVRARQFSSGDRVSPNCQWRPQAVPLIVNAPAVGAGTDTYSNVLQLYEVQLDSGTPYTLDFQRSGQADTHLLLFGNPGQGAYWAPRSARLMDITAPATFTPNRTDTYAIAIVNENLQAGSYTTAVTTGAVDVAGDPEASVRTRITSVAPNPGTGPVTIAFSAASSAPLALEVVDALGRRVATLDAERSGSRGTARWSGRDGHGRQAADGLYIVRLVEAGRTVETRKLIRMR